MVACTLTEMPVLLVTVESSVASLLLLMLLQVYPRAQWPTRQQITGYGAWGGVVAAAALYVVQVSAQ